MIQVKHTFQEHKDEVNLFYEFLEEVVKHDARLVIDPPTNTIKKIKVETIAIAKASFFLMLYNCVESTVVNVFNTILRAMEEDGCKYADLREELQLATLAAYDYRTRETESKDNRNQRLKEQSDYASGLSVVHLDLKSLTSSSSQGNFSGSLDAREIKKLFSRIGMDLSSLNCDEMKKIKECRNKLAHGECSFQDYGRELTIQYIGVSKENTFTYLDGLIQIVDEFITKKQYRRVVRRRKNSLLTMICGLFDK